MHFKWLQLTLLKSKIWKLAIQVSQMTCLLLLISKITIFKTSIFQIAHSLMNRSNFTFFIFSGFTKVVNFLWKTLSWEIRPWGFSNLTIWLELISKRRTFISQIYRFLTLNITKIHLFCFSNSSMLICRPTLSFQTYNFKIWIFLKK